MTLLAPRRTLRVWQSCGLVAWDDGQLHVLVETVGVTFELHLGTTSIAVWLDDGSRTHAWRLGYIR